MEEKSRPRRVLVVDDDPHHNRIVGELLRHAGYEVDVAWNSAEAVRKNFDFRPDLVLLDVMMPRWSGHSACAAMRCVDPSLPIVVVSAKTAPEDVGEGLGWGATRYLTKPFDPDELLGTVRALLGSVPSKT
ncbi:MAG TPA: response regulator transcription factor [Planctomycetota bacterium]|jgi:DNA-binding response OmpR family regulator|nr:response regulator transcription factor [Planctomycetota bacterium]